MVYSDFDKAFEYGITGVPILVANKKYKLVGAQNMKNKKLDREYYKIGQ
jgi:predicted DsbA family dithiol-disulfide isomerase